MLHCDECGPANAARVLFLHPGGYTSKIWQQTAEDLPEMRCLMVDLPGHSESQHVPLTTLEQASDAVADLLTHRYEGDPVHVVGVSFGAYVGLMLGLRYPELVESVMLSGIQLGQIPKSGLLNAFAAVMSPLMRLTWFRRKSAMAFGISDPAIYSHPNGSPVVSPKTFRTIMRLASNFDIADDLPDVAVRVLVTAGSKEHPLILRSLPKFQALIPECRAATATGGGHGWCLQHSKLFAATLRKWIADGEINNDLSLVEPTRPI